jgi:hypothetical protein
MTQITEQPRFSRAPAATPRDRAMAPAAPVERAIRHTALRALGFGGVLGIALIHLLDVFDQIKATPYLGGMYIALMIASVTVAFWLLHTGSSMAWVAAGTLAGLTLLGYVLSGTVGPPNADDDIGNWTEGLGVASMFVEGAILALAAYALALARREA